MTDPRIDPETLAAFLDGRLDERRRAEVLAQLARSRADREILADVTAILGELEAEAGGGRGWRRHAGWLALAAVLAGIVLVPLGWMRLRPRDGDDPARVVALLARAEASLPADWNARPPWTLTRAPDEPLTSSARAVRLGARLVDLELAIRARDSAATAALASEIGALAEQEPGGAPVAAIYRRVAASPTVAVRDSLPRAARRELARVAEPHMIALGAWVEAARVAAAHRDGEFFRARSSASTLEAMPGDERLPASARAQAERVRRAIRDGEPTDWSAVEAELERLLQLIAS